jgi:hypothetical protein
MQNDTAFPVVRIRILDTQKRLLCIYNPLTRNIEIIPVRAGKAQGSRRKKYFIPTDKLRSLGARNVISENPVTEFVVEEEEDA